MYYLQRSAHPSDALMAKHLEWSRRKLYVYILVFIEVCCNDYRPTNTKNKDADQCAPEYEKRA